MNSYGNALDLFSLNDQSAQLGAMFGRPLITTSQMLRDNVSNYISSFGRNIQDNGFVQQLSERFNTIVESNSFSKIRQLERKLHDVWITDEVKTLRALDDFQHALPVMQNYVMAHPHTRRLYQDDCLDAYSHEQWTDPYPNQGVGDKHVVWRDVMTGVVRREEDRVFSVEYLDNGMKERELLDIIDKACITASWNALSKHYEESNTDPTSIENELIG